jgi:hypothetical protein
MRTVIVIALTMLSAVGCSRADAPIHYTGVTLKSNQPWPIGLAKTCLFKDDSKDSMVLVCAASGDPNTDGGTIYLVTADFNKPVRNSGGVFGVLCRLDSFEHATCNTTEGESK